ncbi:hypothetical protein D0862_12122 [Hortaea werneckii]|uniref:GPI ethanolamine phosphate transferase 2 n=1 Tax=Hortaea werneckii TaxID=91943 RepID=A0A3M7EZY3_HORWE|nr:hypothetical protein D0862_12122 [Hortaea werneckii]
MARTITIRFTALALANVLLLVAALVFAVGFFPFKPLLPGLAAFEDVQERETWGDQQPEAIFDRVVFMVVDALRADFVYGHHSGFAFTQELIRSGAAIPFTAHATPPTVTMPRVKAITTGSVPSFADLIFNLDESGSGSTLATQDTWLAQIKEKGGKLVFYGDDTWLRLFPSGEQDGFFERHDGTSSFFVSDFTEVDNNVTRHVPEELARGDWNAMIMHYLGLDHIGHKTGPQGPNMPAKQKEMDGIVQEIYEAMEKDESHRDTLLVLAGDHGMNAGGNHGGSGPGETEPALLFASPKLKTRGSKKEYPCPTEPKEGTDYHFYRKVEQSDIVPTFAGLMGLPISKNSLGVFMAEFYGLWTDAKKGAQLAHQNAKQIKHIVEAAYGPASFHRQVEKWEACYAATGPGCEATSSEEEELAAMWAQANMALQASLKAQNPDWHALGGLFTGFTLAAQKSLSSVASSYDMSKMICGILALAASLGLAIVSFRHVWPPSAAGVFLALTSLLYGVMMFASSYVEEEQHFWYWLTPACTLIMSVVTLKKSQGTERRVTVATAALVIIAVHRVVERWNQTGQKHAGAPDIVHGFFPRHFVLMWMLILITYGYLCYALARRSFLDLIAPEAAVVLAVAIVVPALVFKLNFTQADAPELVQGLAYKIREWTASFSLVGQAQVAFALQGLAAIMVVFMAVSLSRGTILSQPGGPAVRITLAERLHYLLTLFLTMQSRAPNIPLFLGMEAQRIALSHLFDTSSNKENQLEESKRDSNISPTALAVVTLLLSHTYFFCFGGSNSISSVDLSNAYNGVTDYNIVAVGLLLFASNWTGPIWWCSAAVLATFSKPTRSAERLIRKVFANGGRDWVAQERKMLREQAAVSQTKAVAEVPDHWLAYVSCMTAFIATSLVAVMAACTVLRTHLFIWTVFSPKYLFSLAWAVGWHVVINIGFGSLLRWLGRIA